LEAHRAGGWIIPPTIPRHARDGSLTPCWKRWCSIQRTALLLTHNGTVVAALLIEG
jgi:hypothetical protein